MFVCIILSREVCDVCVTLTRDDNNVAHYCYSYKYFYGPQRQLGHSHSVPAQLSCDVQTGILIEIKFLADKSITMSFTLLGMGDNLLNLGLNS